MRSPVSPYSLYLSIYTVITHAIAPSLFRSRPLFIIYTRYYTRPDQLHDPGLYDSFDVPETRKGKTRQDGRLIQLLLPYSSVFSPSWGIRMELSGVLTE